jgi:zinc transport system ATP-binding protein
VDPVLEADHLSIRFGANQVFTDLSFRVERGTSLAIIGPNGAGKTVLCRALIGSIPYEGRVQWAPGVRIGYVPQKLDLERDLPITGADFLRARVAVAGRAEMSLPDAFGLVGIAAEVANRPIGTLSGGQFQRLLIAFALVGKPNVLVLDEPTAGVDAPGQEQLNEVVRRLQEEHGLTVLFISHDLSVVYRYASSVLCLTRGHPCFGPPRTILTPELLHDLYGGPVKYHVHDR